jgi:hypothetical protein
MKTKTIAKMTGLLMLMNLMGAVAFADGSGSSASTGTGQMSNVPCPGSGTRASSGRADASSSTDVQPAGSAGGAQGGSTPPQR